MFLCSIAPTTPAVQPAKEKQIFFTSFAQIRFLKNVAKNSHVSDAGKLRRSSLALQETDAISLCQFLASRPPDPFRHERSRPACVRDRSDGSHPEEPTARGMDRSARLEQLSLKWSYTLQ